jgi:hypothetical protein
MAAPCARHLAPAHDGATSWRRCGAERSPHPWHALPRGSVCVCVRVRRCDHWPRDSAVCAGDRHRLQQGGRRARGLRGAWLLRGGHRGEAGSAAA